MKKNDNISIRQSDIKILREKLENKAYKKQISEAYKIVDSIINSISSMTLLEFTNRKDLYSAFDIWREIDLIERSPERILLKDNLNDLEREINGLSNSNIFLSFSNCRNILWAEVKVKEGWLIDLWEKVSIKEILIVSRLIAYGLIDDDEIQLHILKLPKIE